MLLEVGDYASPHPALNFFLFERRKKKEIKQRKKNALTV